MRHDLRMVVDEIRAHHRMRCFAMEQRKRAYLALGAFVRDALGWSKALPEAERKRIATEASSMIESGEAGGLSCIVSAAKLSVAPFEKIEAEALAAMRLLARHLPVWAAFGVLVRGFGEASLAVIVAEAGDLHAYPSKSKLWKRMGVAVMDGVRQGGLGKGASAEDWIEHGYNPQRRSRLWNTGDALIKGNRDGVYRSCYLARKKYELERDPAMAPIKAHRRAQRYMEKRLLRDLWQAWRKVQAKIDLSVQVENDLRPSI